MNRLMGLSQPWAALLLALTSAQFVGGSVILRVRGVA